MSREDDIIKRAAEEWETDPIIWMAFSGADEYAEHLRKPTAESLAKLSQARDLHGNQLRAQNELRRQAKTKPASNSGDPASLGKPERHTADRGGPGTAATDDTATRVIQDWKTDRAVRATFASAGEYADYLAAPEAGKRQELDRWRAYFRGPPEAATERRLRERDDNLVRDAHGRAAVRDGKARVCSPAAGKRIEPTLTTEEMDVDRDLPIENQCRQIWQRSPAIRAEFRDDFNTYLAYRRAHHHGSARRW